MLQFAQTNKTVFELTSDYIFISPYSPSVFTLTLNGKKLILNGHFHPTWWLSVAVLWVFFFLVSHFYFGSHLWLIITFGLLVSSRICWCCGVWNILRLFFVLFFYVANMGTCASIGTSNTA